MDFVIVKSRFLLLDSNFYVISFQFHVSNLFIRILLFQMI